MPFLILVLVALGAATLLHGSVWGRHLLALGKNETAARYSGIEVRRVVLLAYVLCSGLAGLGGILFALDVNSIQPAVHGNFYELYAIAAAVLGGTSLRGGEGSILGPHAARVRHHRPRDPSRRRRRRADPSGDRSAPRADRHGECRRVSRTIRTCTK
jgi:ribose/xylose/arabinose/galactoside ABC-type transport system permease subunit